ncbi:hypothetical protein JMJ25_002760 [Enterococcus faecalis]|jgi:hypothetical protein|uniref:hypothetical protein n=1 Tax=Enterococcus TaxID=1350 RepID=UPI001159EF46|nr:hypothetical protein [Enterococcus faecalis]EGO2574552.1 hypothetical protein [Enterococcus faecalis]EGO5063902.1 hypothetical protein [Enterococcus faecalis]EGO6081226.1 hypothetical protein [Enterococcus faecalis]EHB4976649.1 hypothetical protein [Enterococcus faecalis]EHE8490699.1 hypothetical protein [Enterococcus faecalis]
MKSRKVKIFCHSLVGFGGNGDSLFKFQNEINNFLKDKEIFDIQQSISETAVVIIVSWLTL